MKRSTSILFGLLAVFLTGWLLVVVIPYLQLGELAPDVDEITQDQTPAAFSGLAEQGRLVYAANGCVYCHTQQVGSGSTTSDIARKLGERRTVARDYLRDRAVYLGVSRMGPDLSNFGARPDDDQGAYHEKKSNADYLYTHFYQPQTISPGTNCPPLRFLFDRRKIVGQPSVESIQLRGSEAPAPREEEVVPRSDAKALAAYLLSLKRTTYKLAEAPEEKTDTP